MKIKAKLEFMPRREDGCCKYCAFYGVPGGPCMKPSTAESCSGGFFVITEAKLRKNKKPIKPKRSLEDF
ncbi:MAG: hypothetical protein F9K32_00590 [Desulfobulbaceae bacterium]|nr:MAG: hypothetical protein F9K32_00590 [Desulfobulbaceae bacterium]